MLPRERVSLALSHEESDRIPWGEVLIDYNIFEDVLGRKSFANSHFYEQKAIWEGKRDEVVAHYNRDIPELTDALELDIVTLPASPFPERGEIVAPLTQISENEYRNEVGDILRVSGSCWLLPFKRNRDAYVEPTVESLEEEIEQVKALPPEDIASSKWEVHRHIVEKMKPTHFMTTLAGGIEFPKFGCDEEDRWINMIEKPEVCRKVAELRGVRSIREIQTFAALGVDAVIPCADLGNSMNLDASPETYRDMVKPWHQKQVDEAHRLGIHILLHCCGHILPIVSEVADLFDAYQAIQKTAGMDIGSLKPMVGDTTTLWGGILHEHLNGGTPSEIREDARYSLSRAAAGGGFILGSTHSLSVGAKIENVWEMKKCRDEWGNYPIKPDTWN